MSQRFLDLLVEHNSLIENLSVELIEPKTSASLLFFGENGIGRETSAMTLAQIILCDLQTGCGQCGSCARVFKKAHESLLIIEAETSSGIKIDQMREVRTFLSRQSWQKKQIVLIKEAQTLNSGAANAILKSLEEPPEDCIFILLAPNPGSLLPTIRSRVRALLFKPLTAEALKTLWQRNFPTAFPQKLLPLCNGSYENLVALHEAELQTSSAWQDLLLQFLENPDFLVSSWREELKERAVAVEFFAQALTWIHQALKAQVNPEFSAIPRLQARSPEELDYLFKKILKIHQEIKQSRDSVLALEGMWVENRNQSWGMQ